MHRLCSPSLVEGCVRSHYHRHHNSGEVMGKLTIRLVYLFIGCITIGPKVIEWLPGGIVGVIGIAYAVLEFIPSIEPPANMRDADAGWGAEQV
jgi:COPI associated protein